MTRVSPWMEAYYINMKTKFERCYNRTAIGQLSISTIEQVV
jgi:hypothetical protein